MVGQLTKVCNAILHFIFFFIDYIIKLPMLYLLTKLKYRFMTQSLPVIDKLSQRVIRVLGCNPGPMTLQGTNTYIIGTGKRRILFDAGDPQVHKYIYSLKKVLSEEQIELSHIIISHWHSDHIGGVPDILNRLKEESRNAELWKYPRSDGFNPKEINNRKVNYFSSEEATISTEGANLRIVHTPGHTTDHIIGYLEDEKVVFSADCILGEGTTVFEDLHDYMNSLNKILNLLPSVIYPGHGPVVESGTSKVEEYINHRMKRENQILDLLSSATEPMSELEIVRLIYKDTPIYLHPAAAVNVKHHLVKLSKDKKVEKVSYGWRLKTTTSNN